MKSNNKTMAYVVGQAIGVIIVSGLGACITGAVVGLTLKFFRMIF